MSTVKTRLSVAAAAALIALAGASVPGAALAKDTKTVHCYGVNACKGQSDCKSAKHDCKGMNDCKGQGFKDLSTTACTKQGGSLAEPK
jgi:uncharacterized membrane protein